MFNIKLIIVYLKNLFLKEKIQDEYIEENSDDTKKIDSKAQKNKRLCSIDFSINNDNTMDIICYWPNLDDLDETTINNIASKYALLLHAINFGIVSQDVTSTLSENLESNNGVEKKLKWSLKKNKSPTLI